jgi:hypothetical protein
LRDGDWELAGMVLRLKMAGEVLHRQRNVFWHHIGAGGSNR